MARIPFGLNVPTAVAGDTDPVAFARRAEELGFDFVSASDHPGSGQPTYETWTMLAWIAAGTSRIGVATRVLGVPWRHPALTAKMAETLDRLSRGRLILGLGGGASPAEFRSFGITPRTPQDTIDGLEEAVWLVRGLWTQPRLSFDGRLYRTENAGLEPKPSRPIPIWLDTFGNRALAVTGRLADGWIPSYDMAPPRRAKVMRERILDAAAEAGREAEDITCVYNIEIHVGEEDVGRPGVMWGPSEAIIERLLECTTIGFRAFNFILVGRDHREQAERIAGEVMPALQASR